MHNLFDLTCNYDWYARVDVSWIYYNYCVFWFSWISLQNYISVFILICFQPLWNGTVYTLQLLWCYCGKYCIHLWSVLIKMDESRFLHAPSLSPWCPNSKGVFPVVVLGFQVSRETTTWGFIAQGLPSPTTKLALLSWSSPVLICTTLDRCPALHRCGVVAIIVHVPRPSSVHH